MHNNRNFRRYFLLKCTKKRKNCANLGRRDKMIETIINEPLALTSNASPITFDETDIRTRCASCSCNGWLDYSNGNPNFKIFGKINGWQ